MENEVECQAEEAECAHMALDDLHIPRFDQNTSGIPAPLGVGSSAA